MDFARDAASPEALREMQKGLREPDERPLWALVDPALLDGKRLRSILVSLGWSAINALQGSPLEVYGEHAPLWIALPTDEDRAAQGLMRLLALDARASALSLVQTAAPQADLLALGAYLSRVLIDGDMLAHCRFADTRVLPELLSNLTPAQRTRVSHAVNAWAWFDHHASARFWSRESHVDMAEHADMAPHLELDKIQFSALLRASEPDTLFGLLNESTPELVPADGFGPFRDHLDAVLGRADARGVTSPNDRLQFAILALSCGPDFDRTPELQATWHDIERGETTLVKAMKGWSDALWDRLQSRHEIPPR
ncbi:DUF4123 domain-containing protein [Pseudorhodoferax sp.]|uniref:DUF4123 domain-containing protein n=1 Tax=Pseudorhodoferax sp. TaxID=1993553 RepID=UPI0039E32177